MKRAFLSVLPFALLLPACRTAGPALKPGPAAAPDSLRPYVDTLRLVRSAGDKPRVRLDGHERAAGGCAVAVRVRAARFEKGDALFSLETIGRPRSNAACRRRLQPELELLLTGLPTTEAEIASRVDAVLLTPEAFLASRGVRFELAPGEAPAVAACRETFATSPESALARQVTSWPELLLAVDPWYHDGSGRVRYEGLVALQAVVGSDGRLHGPRLKAGFSDMHEQAVLRPLSLWRFSPARKADEPVAARVALEPVLHIY